MSDLSHCSSELMKHEMVHRKRLHSRLVQYTYCSVKLHAINKTLGLNWLKKIKIKHALFYTSIYLFIFWCLITRLTGSDVSVCFHFKFSFIETQLPIGHNYSPNTQHLLLQMSLCSLSIYGRMLYYSDLGNRAIHTESETRHIIKKHCLYDISITFALDSHSGIIWLRTEICIL